jgi:hypothetical protein
MGGRRPWCEKRCASVCSKADAISTKTRCWRGFAETLPAGVRVTVLADRGFFDHRWLDALQTAWGFDHAIRMRCSIQVTVATGETCPVAQWVGRDGRTRTLREAAVTGEQYPVATVVCVQAKGMKDRWCLVASDP